MTTASVPLSPSLTAFLVSSPFGLLTREAQNPGDTSFSSTPEVCTTSTSLGRDVARSHSSLATRHSSLICRNYLISPFFTLFLFVSFAFFAPFMVEGILIFSLELITSNGQLTTHLFIYISFSLVTTCQFLFTFIHLTARSNSEPIYPSNNTKITQTKIPQNCFNSLPLNHFRKIYKIRLTQTPTPVTLASPSCLADYWLLMTSLYPQSVLRLLHPLLGEKCLQQI